MGYFLEERLSELIRYGSTWTEEFAVREVKTSGGGRYGALIHPYPVRIFDSSWMLDVASLWPELVNTYMRAYGTFAGFRARCFDEYSTNGPKGAPTAFDQPLGLVSAGVYELRKYYGTDKAALATLGYPHRKLKKPVAGTTRAAIGSIELASANNWSVDTTTGRLTFATNIKVISGITQAASAVVLLPINHGFTVGMSAYFSGVAGMTQINGLRGRVINTGTYSITVDINSSAFSGYTAGGTVTTLPAAGESVSGGCEFDFPIHFVTKLPVGMDYPGWRPVESLQFEELLNP